MGREITGKADVECAAQCLLDRGTNAVLIKGGGMAGLVGKDFFAAGDGAASGDHNLRFPRRIPMEQDALSVLRSRRHWSMESLLLMP